jgi:hypothetical protein
MGDTSPSHAETSAPAGGLSIAGVVTRLLQRFLGVFTGWGWAAAGIRAVFGGLTPFSDVRVYRLSRASASGSYGRLHLP